MIGEIARLFDLLILAFAFGATVWFFFVQTPVLLRWKGKEKFIPIQMRLTKTLFAVLAATVPVMLGLALVHGSEQLWLHIATAGVAAFGALVNHFVVVPRALRAGGRALRTERESEEDDRSITDFASRGGGEESKTWHRLVVVFVVVMLGGMVSHGFVLTSSGGHVSAASHPHAHSPETEDHESAVGHGHHLHAAAAPDDEHEPSADLPTADAATTRNVGKLHAVVQSAIEDAQEPGAAVPEVRAAYQQIFAECEMTGDDHEQLHHFLVPIGEEIEALDEGDDDALTRLDARLSEFGERFRMTE